MFSACARDETCATASTACRFCGGARPSSSPDTVQHAGKYVHGGNDGERRRRLWPPEQQPASGGEHAHHAAAAQRHRSLWRLLPWLPRVPLCAHAGVLANFSFFQVCNDVFVLSIIFPAMQDSSRLSSICLVDTSLLRACPLCCRVQACTANLYLALLAIAHNAE